MNSLPRWTACDGKEPCRFCHLDDDNEAPTIHAEVRPTGLDVEPTALVEVSIEALRTLAGSAGFRLVEHVIPPGSQQS